MNNHSVRSVVWIFLDVSFLLDHIIPLSNGTLTGLSQSCSRILSEA